MKRRTFVKTVLGALAVVGLGKKLIDSENQGLVTKIAGNNGPKGCEGKFNGIWNRLNKHAKNGYYYKVRFQPTLNGNDIKIK